MKSTTHRKGMKADELIMDAILKTGKQVDEQHTYLQPEWNPETTRVGRRMAQEQEEQISVYTPILRVRDCLIKPSYHAVVFKPHMCVLLILASWFHARRSLFPL